MCKKSLAESHPELAKQAYGWDASKISRGSAKKLPWICEKGHIWESVVGNRTVKNYGCPVCSNKKVLVGFNDLKTTHPEISAQAHGWNPEEVTAGSSNNKLPWICDKGHIWHSTPNNRLQGRGCPYCAGRK